MKVNRKLVIPSLLLAFITLSGCDKKVELYQGVNVCNYQINQLGEAFSVYAQAPKDKPCLIKTAGIAYDWSTENQYQADISRFDIDVLQGKPNTQNTLEGSWLLVYDFAGINNPDNGQWNRQICNLRQKSGETNVYQADCPLLQHYGDLSFDPVTASISNDGIGQWPTDDYALGQEVALSNIAVENFSKINGTAEFTRLRGAGEPTVSYSHAFSLVRIGDINQSLGTLQLRDAATADADANAPYTSTWTITSFKESLAFDDASYLTALAGFDKQAIRLMRYELAVEDGQGQQRVLIAENNLEDRTAQYLSPDLRINSNWVRADTENRDYYCLNNGSNNGCADIQTYPSIGQFIDYSTLPEYVLYEKRSMIIGQQGLAVDDTQLIIQEKAYFDTLQDNAQGLKIHFRYNDGTNNQDGLISLSY